MYVVFVSYIKIYPASSSPHHRLGRRTFATDVTTTASAAAAATDSTSMDDGTVLAATSDGTTSTDTSTDVSAEVDYKVFTPQISPDEVLDNGEGDVIDIPDLADSGLDYPLGSSADI